MIEQEYTRDLNRTQMVEINNRDYSTAFILHGHNNSYMSLDASEALELLSFLEAHKDVLVEVVCGQLEEETAP